jgi:hypothetical protein
LIAELLVHMNRNDMPFLVRRTLGHRTANPEGVAAPREPGVRAVQ